LSRAPAAWPLAATLATAPSVYAAPAAIINKQLAARGHRTFATPGDMATALFDGSPKVQTAMKVIAAVVLLGALAATLAGVWQTLRGERGGLELTASGVFGVVGLMAALTVVM
jgi:hypothetical protein